MPRVFIITDKMQYDVSDAASFGEIVPLTDRAPNPINTDAAISLFMSRLMAEKYDPAKDYLCLTGHQLVTALFLSTAVSGYGSVKTLMFDARSSRYVERVVRSAAA